MLPFCAQMDDLRARELLAPGPASPPEPEPVPRVSAQDLTFEEFFNNYAKQKKVLSTLFLI